MRGGTESVIDRPTSTTRVAGDIVDDICRWVGQGDAGAVPTTTGPEPRTTATIGWHGGSVEEEVLHLGEAGLVGVLTRPVGIVPGHGGVAELGFGAPCRTRPGVGGVLPGVGPVGLHLVSPGLLRWGESPDRGHAPGRAYDQHGVDEVREAVGV